MNERLGAQRASAYCQLQLNGDEIAMRQLLIAVLDDPDDNALHAFTTSLAGLACAFGRRLEGFPELLHGLTLAIAYTEDGDEYQ